MKGSKPSWRNLETRYRVERIIQALQARRRGTLCFYGPPGTGKTALAEHIAAALELPLMMARFEPAEPPS